ncbi:hypothetical protein [Nocardia sp. NPDC050406]|uniref:hypothetical protein n=1 Tax=Nocardia sp. NPDC050406 TaxID=3364318 RepID=UPI00379D80AC
MSDNESSEPTEAVSLDKEVPAEPKRRVSLPRPGRRTVTTIAATAVVSLCATIGSTVYFYDQHRDSQEILDAREEARLAACAYAPTLATYDAKNLDAWITGVMAGATGDWRTQFDSTSKDLKEVLAKGEVVSKATDVQCAIRTGDATSAEAIVIIGQTITSLGTQGKASPGQLSTVLHLEKSGDRWLVNKVDSPLGVPQR